MALEGPSRKCPAAGWAIPGSTAPSGRAFGAATALRRLPAAAVCSLAAHALVYRTLRPAGGAHGYFGWYEPAVAAASFAALVGLAGFLLVASAARRAGRPLPLRVAASPVGLGPRARGLASASLLFLVVQESLERSFAAGHPAAATFPPSQWLGLLSAVAVTSLALALALRAASIAVERMLGGPRGARRRERGAGRSWTVVTHRPRCRPPLALGVGLRAPPVVLS